MAEIIVLLFVLCIIVFLGANALMIVGFLVGLPAMFIYGIVLSIREGMKPQVEPAFDPYGSAPIREPVTDHAPRRSLKVAGRRHFRFH